MVLINSCPDRLDPTTAASRALSRSPTPRAFMVYRDQISVRRRQLRARLHIEIQPPRLLAHQI